MVQSCQEMMAHQKMRMYLLPILCHTFTTILVLQNTYECYLSFCSSGAQAGLKGHKAAFKVLFRAIVSMEAQLSKNLLPHSLRLLEEFTTL